MSSRLAASFGLITLLVMTGCELMTAGLSTSYFRPRRQETSWETTMKSMGEIPFRGPVLTPSDPIPTLVARPIEPKHPEKFHCRHGGYELNIATRRPAALPVTDEEQLAASLKWLEEEFGIPPEIELHRGITKSSNGADPNEVSLFGWYRGLRIPAQVMINLERDQVVGASVWLLSVSEVSESARTVVGVETARATMEEWLHAKDGESKRKAAKLIWPVHHCRLQFERPEVVPENGDDLLIPAWSCDSRNVSRVAAYDGTPYRLRIPKE